MYRVINGVVVISYVKNNVIQMCMLTNYISNDIFQVESFTKSRALYEGVYPYTGVIDGEAMILYKEISKI